MDHKIITLADGRSLGFAEYGDLQGRALLFFHSQPGNRLFRHPDDRLTSSLGVRLITMDRPEYGLSDFQPKRSLLDWPHDVCESADALGIDRFTALSFSARGPYALVCAHHIPDRLTRVGIVDGAPPMHLREINAAAPGMLRIIYWLARHVPSAMDFYFRLFWSISRCNPHVFLQMAVKQSCQADKNVLSQPDISAVLQEVWRENIRVDSRGYVYDAEILRRSQKRG